MLAAASTPTAKRRRRSPRRAGQERATRRNQEARVVVLLRKKLGWFREGRRRRMGLRCNHIEPLHAKPSFATTQAAFRDSGDGRAQRRVPCGNCRSVAVRECRLRLEGGGTSWGSVVVCYWLRCAIPIPIVEDRVQCRLLLRGLGSGGNGARGTRVTCHTAHKTPRNPEADRATPARRRRVRGSAEKAVRARAQRARVRDMESPRKGTHRAG
jgi:hypothetical protein